MKRFIILVLLVVLEGVGWGAMTRDQVCIEQNVFNQASPEAGTRRGFNVWTPYGDISDEWICWNMTMTPQFKLTRYNVTSTITVGNTYRLTSGATNIDVVGASSTLDTTEKVAAALAVAWNASESADCTPITAFYYTNAPAFVYLGAIPGTDFTVTGTEVEGSAFATNPEAAGTTQPRTYSLNTAFKAKIKAGYYLGLNKSIVNGSAGPVWYPTPSAGTWGAGVDVTNSSAWSIHFIANAAGYNGFTYMYPATDTRDLLLKVPSGVTRLYCIGIARAAGTVAVSQPAATCTINDASLDFSLTGDFIAYGEDQSFGWSATNGYPHYKSVALVATNFTDDTVLTFNPDTSSMPYIVGFIAINDNATAQPDTGVFDPTTITYLMPTSYDSSGTQLSYGQVTDGPIALQYGSGGTATFWGNSHWSGWAGMDVVNNLAASSTYVSYDRSAFSSITSTTFSSPADNTEVRYVAINVSARSTGTISFSDGTNDLTDIGTYTLVYSWSSNGLSISQRYAFNSGVTGGSGMYLSIAGGDNGGVSAAWSISKGFNAYKFPPYSTQKQTITAAYNDGYETAVAGTRVTMFNSAIKMTADLLYSGTVYDASTNGTYSKPSCNIQRRATGDGYVKLLCYLIKNDPDTDIALGVGDIINTFQMRTFTPTESVSKTTIYDGGSGIFGN